MMGRLNDIDAVFSSTSKTADQLGEAKEVNGQLQEKLRGVESALEQSDTDREKLKSNEEHLNEQIRNLQTEITDLKDEMAAQSHGDANTASEMQIQFDATSSALTEATESVRAKENEIQSLNSELQETKNSLESSEVLIATLETERSQIQGDASKIEQRVREELARASLKSKDQSRALFEQEQHKLNREKELAEKNAQKFKEQLEVTKSSLVCALFARLRRLLLLTTRPGGR